ncbi:MAG: FAD-dependent oxidoreductase, partial [Acidocella sp.]|nr:FAD-dependent oxidoreductase [Acidocella sp.]
AGMSAAWLLSHAHHVTIYEQANRVGGHGCTVLVPDGARRRPVDMGFIVYNPPAYPNLVALLRTLGVATDASEMSFAVSARGGKLEYAGTNLAGLFAQPVNLVRPRFWSMLRDTMRFFREAPAAYASLDPGQCLNSFLATQGYGAAFIEDHLLPMAAAIWSTPAGKVGAYPAAAFLRFCDNHGLLQATNRPAWRTVRGGAEAYIARLTARYAHQIKLGLGVRQIRRATNGVYVRDTAGMETRFDQLIVATHSDQALKLLDDPSDAEAQLLGAISYGNNEAVMHRDPRLMPKRRRVWSSWNYLDQGDARMCVSYWMNRLQKNAKASDIFVTLNPPFNANGEIARETFAHPLFDAAAMRAQRELWQLQGVQRTWYCGAYFGSGFHEDGLQAGLAVAEALGGMRRPWDVPNQSGRITLGKAAMMQTA